MIPDPDDISGHPDLQPITGTLIRQGDPLRQALANAINIATAVGAATWGVWGVHVIAGWLGA